MIKVVSWRKTDYVILIIMEKSHQNTRHNNVQAKELAKYVKESIQQDHIVPDKEQEISRWG